MPIKAIGPEIEILHERQMACRHIAVLPISGELESLAEYGNRHEDSIAHSVARPHRFFHLSCFAKADARGVLHHLYVTWVTRAFRQLSEYEITRKIPGHGPARLPGFGAVDKGCDQTLNVGRSPQAELPDKTHAWNVGEIVELPPIDLGQLAGEFPGRARLAPLDFPMRLGARNFLKCDDRVEHAHFCGDAP